MLFRSVPGSDLDKPRCLELADDLGLRHVLDRKSKELVGAFKNAGRTWRPAKTPQRVCVHDFVVPATATTGGKAIPYGVYDLQRNEGWVSVGIDHDTATCAVRSIARWWRCMGRGVYRGADTLVITADAGGSNGARLRLWKWELQQLATRTGLAIAVCHFPPGTSKWDKIEHRVFSHIAMNWRGTPLVDLATIVSLIGSTHSRSGLRVRSELDRGAYPSGVTVTDAQMATIRLEHRLARAAGRRAFGVDDVGWRPAGRRAVVSR